MSQRMATCIVGGIMGIPYLGCMALVAALYHLPPRVLPAIQAVEGGYPGLEHPNGNGSRDLGVMQVNTVWLEPLARYTRMPVATVYRRLRDEACYNIAAAGAIMRTHLDRTHGILLEAIGDYHSHTPTLNRTYQLQVQQSAARLFATLGPAP
ncbi:MAG: lytic transglycosylase domain-containing protein [Komagataeibacter saccharivorans]|uniref:lytic transglycosylase domain-containing protein n=1 Tax=Komagataeibacter saccharivorans TaxID=265959 RepID=UPI00345D0AC8